MSPLESKNILRFKGIVGTGGIGSGKFFVINGDHTLGREESRSGHFNYIKDYCKQHIILHYIAVLLGEKFSVVPVGLVGDDDIGETLLEEMNAVGMVLEHVGKQQGLSTLFSFCFSYPDGSGGNLTTDNSASANVDERLISNATGYIRRFGSNGIVLAAPEVPMKARQKLLELGRSNQSFCAAAFTSEEIVDAGAAGMLNNTDLIAINWDEAKALIAGSSEDKGTTIESVIAELRKYNQNIMISVTAGIDGSWCWDGAGLQHCNVFPTTVASSAGAGDAFFAGLICGLAVGLTLHQSQWLASLVASFSVTSKDTIHWGLDRVSLATFAKTSKGKLPSELLSLLKL
ncbi:MAG: carbohydrate kinase family protein [Chryseolinea sp.]